MAHLQQTLYPDITADDILARQAEPFEPVQGASPYRVFALTDDRGDVISTGHLRLRHNQDSQTTERIERQGDEYRLLPLSHVCPSEQHEIEIGGAVVNPRYAGRGLGKLLMRDLTYKALATPHIITRTAKGFYSPEQMARVVDHIKRNGRITTQELNGYTIAELPRNLEASKASMHIAHEFGMEYGGVSPLFGGPFFYHARRDL